MGMQKAAKLGFGSALSLLFGFVFNDTFLKIIAGRGAVTVQYLPAGEILGAVIALILFVIFLQVGTLPRFAKPLHLQFALFISSLLCGFIGGILGAAVDDFRLLHL